MSTDTKSARTIFLDALDHAHINERDRLLDSACAGDDSLRHEVRRLLEAHGDLNSFMASPAAVLAPAASLSATINLPAGEQVGATIGRYKLLEQIGEGGMGVVYVAEQTEPVRRRVALKIIKPGMDTRQVIARFEAERQALAMMDHPNIAKVLDAGTTGESPASAGSGLSRADGIRAVILTPHCRDLPAAPTSSWSWSAACRSPTTATRPGSTRAAGSSSS